MNSKKIAFFRLSFDHDKQKEKLELEKKKSARGLRRDNVVLSSHPFPLHFIFFTAYSCFSSSVHTINWESGRDYEQNRMIIIISRLMLLDEHFPNRNRPKLFKSRVIHTNCVTVVMFEFRLPACRRLLFPLLHAEKGRLRNTVANRVPASRWVPKILRTCCDRLTHSAHCST